MIHINIDDFIIEWVVLFDFQPWLTTKRKLNRKSGEGKARTWRPLLPTALRILPPSPVRVSNRKSRNARCGQTNWTSCWRVSASPWGWGTSGGSPSCAIGTAEVSAHSFLSILVYLKTLCLYLLGQNCLHHTFNPYLSSKTYFRKYEKLLNKVIHACKNITEKMILLKMCGLQIRLCLFTFRPIGSKQLNSLTTIDTLCWRGGAEVTHPLWVREVTGSFPGSDKGFYVWYFVCPKPHYLSQHFAIPFAILICLVYLTYCKIGYRI